MYILQLMGSGTILYNIGNQKTSHLVGQKSVGNRMHLLRPIKKQTIIATITIANVIVRD